MIKINLATKKQASYAMGEGRESGTQTFLGRIPISKEDLEDIPLRKIFLSIIACLMGGFILDDLKSSKIQNVDKEIVAKQEIFEKLKKSSKKTKSIDKIKKQMERDEFVIRTKIETIQKVILDRRQTAEMLISLSELIPKEVWLSRFNVGPKRIEINGRSKDFNFVSDFMKNLGESSYFAELSLDSTKQVIVNGKSLAEFILRAKNGNK